MKQLTLLPLMVVTACGLYFLWLSLYLFLPPTAPDELIYHLQIPKEILRTGGWMHSPDNIYAYFPNFGEMLFLFGMSLAGEPCARAFHLLAAVLLAFAQYRFGRKYLSQPYSFLSVLILLSVPSFMVVSTWAYVDLFYALFVFVATVSLLRFFETSELKWVVLAGVFIGGSIATKYVGLQFLVLACVLILVERLRCKRLNWIRGIIFTSVPAILIAVPYLIRNWIQTGWPLFPFNVGFFQLREGINWDPERARLYLGWASHFGEVFDGKWFWNRLIAPVAVFVIARFNDWKRYDGVIGPVFLLTPFVLIGVKKHVDIKRLSLFCLLFMFVWTMTTRQVRFLLPVLPFAGILLAYGLEKMRGKLKLFALSFVILLLGINFITGFETLWQLQPLNYWLGKESRDEYLSRRVPSYPIYRAANQLLKLDDRVYLIHMKNYVYFLDRPWRSDFVFERYRLDQLLKSQPTAQALADFFRSQKVTHLLVDEDFIASPQWGFEPSELGIFRQFISRFSKPLVSDRNYTLYRLTDQSPR